MRVQRLIAIAGVALISGCAPTVVSERANPHVEITWAGIYTADRISAGRGANGVIEHEVTNPEPVRATTEIPAQRGIRFGVLYEVSGAPAELRRLVRYPAPGALVPSARTPLLYDEIKVQCAVGTTCMTGYGLDQPWEMMPGTWTFEFWSGDRKLAEQSFTVVRQ